MSYRVPGIATRNDRAYWNQRYAEGSHESRDPDPFLVKTYDEFIAPFFPSAGRALDIAGGTGRHSLWLASHGWSVTMVDVSDVGLGRAQRRWGQLKPPGRNRPSSGQIEFVAADLEAPKSYKIARRAYDLVLVLFYLQRSLFPALKRALKPGGLLVYKTYTLEHRKFGRGPTHPMYFLEPNELLHAFSSLHILHYHESVKDKGVAEIVVRNL
ncbi:MAG: class I SAM-dependent methyltransferase [Acidobacteriaceae bacterium]|nr:class I SAM-dependent methyltransferase [Acidobacteriaceae bacterium]